MKINLDKQSFRKRHIPHLCVYVCVTVCPCGVRNICTFMRKSEKNHVNAAETV